MKKSTISIKTEHPLPPGIKKENNTIVLINNYLNACVDQEIDVFIGLGNEICTHLEFNSFRTALANSGVCEIENVKNAIGVVPDKLDNPIHVEFPLEKLINLSETDFQTQFLMPLQHIAGLNVVDTHASNTRAKNLCVSPPTKDIISWDAKPDLIHSGIPMLLEIKSRINKSSSVLKREDISLEDSEDVGKDDITVVEVELLEQCLERILEQFRAYLSKIVVFAQVILRGVTSSLSNSVCGYE